ncbi:sigma factor-like helix-turn-helix DNA-binding protein [Amycolatopsis sp. NPDC051045]|uniref:RNA polymerase sigma factor n=1 Tax=Amycolatopsis sp. NPDC051045 TaxID=3156922 RepID=UPI00342B7C03
MKNLMRLLAGIDELIEKSSFGTPGARSMRDRTSSDLAEAIIERVADPAGVPDALVAAPDGQTTMLQLEGQLAGQAKAGLRSLTIDDLIGSAVAGESKAIGELVNRVVGPVTVYCRARLGTKNSRAEDLLQDVCIRALMILPEFTGSGDDFLRSIFQVAEAEVDAAANLVSPPRGDPAVRVVNALPPLDRTVIVLRAAAGLTSADVATILAITPDRVRHVQHRALVRLREAFRTEQNDLNAADGLAKNYDDNVAQTLSRHVTGQSQNAQPLTATPAFKEVVHSVTVGERTMAMASVSAAAVNHFSTADLWLDSPHNRDPMTYEDELLRDLATLRRGRGLEGEQLRGRLGPLIHGWCGIHESTNDREARRVLRDAISSAIAEFPADDRLAVNVALGIAPGTQHAALSDRVGVLADRLRVSERTARRRIDRSFARLAAEIEASARPGDAASNPDPGWFVKRLNVLVRLDTAEPELIEERLIVATRDGLSRISAQFTVPRPDEGDDGERQVAVDAQHGVRITDAERMGQRHFRWLLDLPRPLAQGETHTYSLAFRVRDGAPIRPSYIFVPLMTCESLSVRVRFDPRRPPEMVWGVDRVQPSVLADPSPPGPPLALDGACEVAQEFAGPQQGYAYGLRWLNHDVR